MSKKRSTATRRAESQAAQERAAAIRAEHERGERRRRSLVVGAVVVGVLLLVVGIGYAVQSARDTTGGTASAPAGAVDTYALPAGPADAPATVTVYEDFLCPICGEFEAASGEWLTEYAEQGKVQVRYVPISILDRMSNGTDYSTRAANATAVVLDAAGAETAKSFHDLLFENQPPENTDGLTDEQLVDLAVEAGAERDAVEQGIEDRVFEQWVENSTDAASQIEDFEGTPYVALDGERFSEGGTFEELSTNLREAVDARQ